MDLPVVMMEASCATSHIMKVYGAMTEEWGATSRMKIVWCY